MISVINKHKADEKWGVEMLLVLITEGIFEEVAWAKTRMRWRIESCRYWGKNVSGRGNSPWNGPEWEHTWGAMKVQWLKCIKWQVESKATRPEKHYIQTVRRRGLDLALSVMRTFRRFWSGKWHALVYKHHRVPLAVVRRINYRE